MRNIVFANLVTFALFAAQSFAEGVPQHGCFAKVYTKAHLAAHPDQVVAAMQLQLFVTDGLEGMNAESGSTVAYLSVILANQGHVLRGSFPSEDHPDGYGGEFMYQSLRCGMTGRVCAQECMGETDDYSSFEVLRNDDETLTLRLSSLWVGQGQSCGGYTNLAEVPGQYVTYVLNRVDDVICEQGF